MKFIILSQQRAGSHMLMNLLNSHSKIHCNGDHQTKDVISNGKQWTFDSGFSLNKPCSGFLLKIKTNLIKDINLDDEIKIIYLKRKNLLDILLSKKMAKLYGCYEKKEAGADIFNAKDLRSNTDPIYISPIEAENFFLKFKKMHKETKQHLLKLDHIEIYYSDIVKNANLEFKKIYKFLDINYEEPTFSSGRGMEKLDIRTKSRSIENYKELRLFFKHSEWGEYFYDMT